MFFHDAAIAKANVRRGVSLAWSKYNYEHAWCPYHILRHEGMAVLVVMACYTLLWYLLCFPWIRWFPLLAVSPWVIYKIPLLPRWKIGVHLAGWIPLDVQDSDDSDEVESDSGNENGATDEKNNSSDVDWWLLLAVGFCDVVCIGGSWFSQRLSICLTNAWSTRSASMIH